MTYWASVPLCGVLPPLAGPYSGSSGLTTFFASLSLRSRRRIGSYASGGIKIESLSGGFRGLFAFFVFSSRAFNSSSSSSLWLKTEPGW